MQTSIIITDQTGSHQLVAAPLAATLKSQGILVPDSLQSAEFELCFSPNGLKLQGKKQGETESIMVDFGHDSFLYRLMKGGGRKQALGRAMGLKPGYSPLVLDATAGMGRDGFLLASLGCRVILCERSAIIHALLSDGLSRAAGDSRLNAVVSRITLHMGDSLQLLPTLTHEHRPEVIYLDPMFPQRSKSALVKKEMRMVRAVVGDDQDTNALLQMSLAHAEKRVVCKRPSQAPPLAGRQPDFAITTPKHRFDVYLVPHGNQS